MTRVAFVCDSDAWGGAEVYLTHPLRRAAHHGWSASLVCAEPVAADVPCAPCPHLVCPIDFRCATSVRPESVVSAARELVSAPA